MRWNISYIIYVSPKALFWTVLMYLEEEEKQAT